MDLVEKGLLLGLAVDEVGHADFGRSELDSEVHWDDVGPDGSAVQARFGVVGAQLVGTVRW